MRRSIVNSKKSGGFTLVEVCVTIVVASLFIIAITQLFLTQNTISTAIKTYTKADSLAYNNLRTFAYGERPTWFVCTKVTPGDANSLAKPMVIFNKTDDVSGITSPVIQTVTATAPYGCGGSAPSYSAGYPIKVESAVTYGTDGKKVVHATYSTY